MKFTALASAALGTLAIASPLTSPLTPLADSAMSPRAASPLACTVGSQYCGWALLDGGLGWDQSVLRFYLCDALGECDWTSNKAWNYIWYCQRKYFAVPQKLCGTKDNTCLGPSAHCA